MGPILEHSVHIDYVGVFEVEMYFYFPDEDVHHIFFQNQFFLHFLQTAKKADIFLYCQENLTKISLTNSF